MLATWAPTLEPHLGGSSCCECKERNRKTPTIPVPSWSWQLCDPRGLLLRLSVCLSVCGPGLCASRGLSSQPGNALPGPEGSGLQDGHISSSLLSYLGKMGVVFPSSTQSHSL